MVLLKFSFLVFGNNTKYIYFLILRIIIKLKFMIFYFENSEKKNGNLRN